MSALANALLLMTSLLVANYGTGSHAQMYRWQNVYRQWDYAHAYCYNTNSYYVNFEQELQLQFTDALVDMIYRTMNSTTRSSIEICHSLHNVHQSAITNISKLNYAAHDTGQVLEAKNYVQKITKSREKFKAVAAALAIADYVTHPEDRGKFNHTDTMTLTTAPSQYELADTVLHLLINQSWGYAALITDAEDEGAVHLARILQHKANSSGKVCFAFAANISEANSSALAAAISLRQFAYRDKNVQRLTVVYIGSGRALTPLWSYTVLSDSQAGDNEKRYQFVFVGSGAFGVYHWMTDSSTKRHHMSGSLFVFPGILDPDPVQDQLSRYFYSSSSSALPLGSTVVSRLNALKSGVFDALCGWSSPASKCYTIALQYDFSALATIAAMNLTSVTASPAYNALRTTELSFPSSIQNIIAAFIRANYTKFSLAHGLYHADLGYHQPIIKIYQSQLQSSQVKLNKVGEVRVSDMGRPNQTYISEYGQMYFYSFRGRDPTSLPVPASSSASSCPRSCPECAAPIPEGAAYPWLDFKEGDIYLGALVPVRFKDTDHYGCTDSTFTTKKLQGYELAIAFKYIIQWANLFSQGITELPPGFDESKMDRDFILGVKSLLNQVNKLSSRPLRIGYVIMDTCRASPYTLKHLSKVLDGTLPLKNFNVSALVGFIGALSSTQTIAASQLLRWYHLPLISYSSTSTALTDFDLFPYTFRTCASDTVIIEAMVSMLKYFAVDYVAVVYTATAYGRSLWAEFQRIATREGICINRNLTFDESCNADGCKRSIVKDLIETGARYVPFLSNLVDFKRFLDYSTVEAEIQYITFLMPETMGVSEAAFQGRNNVGVGMLSIQLMSSSSPGISHYLSTQMATMPSSANLSVWDRLYFEDVHKCYLTDSLVGNNLHLVPCDRAKIIRSDISDIESFTPFAAEATATLLLGTLAATSYTCTRPRPSPICEEFLKSDFISRQARANRIMYNKGLATADDWPQRFHGNYEGSDWSYQRIFANRMGRTQMSLWQYRQLRSSEYGFVRIGLFNNSEAEFTSTAEQLQSHERRSSVAGGCYSRLTCAAEMTCNNARTRGFAGSLVEPVAASNSLLAWLFLPGVLVGAIVGAAIGVACCYRRKKDEDEYDRPINNLNTTREASSPPLPRQRRRDSAVEEASGRKQQDTTLASGKTNPNCVEARDEAEMHSYLQAQIPPEDQRAATNVAMTRSSIPATPGIEADDLYMYEGIA